MTKPVVLTRRARAEIAAAAQWHEERRQGLGDEFLDRVDEAIDNIAANPAGYAPVYKDARRVNLRQFRDWALWFKVMPDNSLVIACMSSKRNPRLAVERAFGVIPIPKPPEPE